MHLRNDSIALPFPSAAQHHTRANIAFRPATLDLSTAIERPHINAGTGTYPAKCFEIAAEGGVGTKIYRVKDALHGDFVTAMEVLNSKIFRLTGLQCPRMEIAHLSAMQTEGFSPGPAHRLHVASEYSPSYRDLGAFLLSDDAFAEIKRETPDMSSAYDALRKNHQAIQTKIDAITQAHGPFWSIEHRQRKASDAQTRAAFDVVIAQYAALDKQRFDFLEALFDLLPNELKEQVRQHHVASRFIANWDTLNVFMQNLGFARTEDRKWVAMTVDFGASGVLGFQGADSSTKRNKDEPGDGWLRMPRHHGRSNRQVQVARCTSTSAEKNDTKSTVS